MGPGSGVAPAAAASCGVGVERPEVGVGVARPVGVGVARPVGVGVERPEGRVLLVAANRWCGDMRVSEGSFEFLLVAASRSRGDIRVSAGSFDFFFFLDAFLDTRRPLAKLSAGYIGAFMVPLCLISCLMKKLSQADMYVFRDS